MRLLPHQEEMRKTLSGAKFKKEARSFFEAWLKRYFGNRHVARAVIRYGVSNVDMLVNLRAALEKEAQEDQANKRKRNEEAQHGAEETVWKLRDRAIWARKTLRLAQSLLNKINNKMVDMDYLTDRQRTLLEDLDSRKLHADVDRANKDYGHGMARTNDFSFRVGENMCCHIPTDVRAHLRLLKRRQGA